MDIFDFFTPSSIGNSLLGGIGSAFANIGAGNRMRKQYKYQSRLMDQQAAINKDLAEQQFNYQNEMAQSQFQYTTDLTEMQREYDDPSQQVARLRNAGLSPGAMAQGGMSNVAKAGPTPSMNPGGTPGLASVGQGQASVLPFADPTQSITAMAQARLANAQARSIENQTPSTDEFHNRYATETRTLLAQAVDSEADASFTEYQESFQRAMEATRADTLRTELDNLKEQGRLLTQQILESSSATLLNHAKADESNAHRDLLQAQAVTQIYEQALITYKMNLIEHQIEWTDAQKNLFDTQARQYLASAEFKEFENQFWMSSVEDRGKGKTKSNYADKQIRDMRNTTSDTAFKWAEATVGQVSNFIDKCVGGLIKAVASRTGAQAAKTSSEAAMKNANTNASKPVRGKTTTREYNKKGFKDVTNYN